MPSSEHEEKIEEISREIKARGMNWRVKKNFPIWMPDNKFGMIDIIGFKSKSSFSKAEVDAYEVEERNNQSQVNRNFEKLQQLSKSFSPDIDVSICQLKANENHKEKCGRFRRPTKPRFQPHHRRRMFR